MEALLAVRSERSTIEVSWCMSALTTTHTNHHGTCSTHGQVSRLYSMSRRDERLTWVEFRRIGARAYRRIGADNVVRGPKKEWGCQHMAEVGPSFLTCPYLGPRVAHLYLLLL